MHALHDRSHEAQYNTLWAIAYQYASDRGMTPARVAQFASDYARCFEGVILKFVGTPEAYEVMSASVDYHYHG